MFKRIAALVVTAGIISALLLYAGTTLMGNFTSAFASSLPALVTGIRSGGVDDSLHTVATQAASTADNRKGADKPEDNPTNEASETPDPTPSNTPQATPVPASNVTVAQLLSGSTQFEDGVFTITGIATRVSNDKFLLNDGTGQILVDLEDDLVKVTVLDGAMVTVTGEFRSLGGQNSMGLKACVVTGQNGTAVLDNCETDRHGELEPTDDHGGQTSSTPGADDHGGSTSPTSGPDDHGGSNSGSGSSNSGSGSDSSNSGSGSSGSGSHGGDDNPKP